MRVKDQQVETESKRLCTRIMRWFGREQRSDSEYISGGMLWNWQAGGPEDGVTEVVREDAKFAGVSGERGGCRGQSGMEADDWLLPPLKREEMGIKRRCYCCRYTSHP